MFEPDPYKRITLKQIEDIFVGKYVKPIIEGSKSSDSNTNTESSDDGEAF